MRSQRIGPVTLVALSYALALLSHSVLASDNSDTTSLGCVASYKGDDHCDLVNNNADCGYDGGDCCECTCFGTGDSTCGGHDPGNGFACVDPSVPCFKGGNDKKIEDIIYDGVGYGNYYDDDDDNDDDNDDDDDDNDDDDDDMSASYSYEYDSYELPLELPESVCRENRIGDGDCHLSNNVEKCDYDGGDCCECTCDYTIPYVCDLHFDPVDCIDPSAPCVNDYVEAGTKTTVGVSAIAYDTRPGQYSNNGGCQEDGCAPSVTRDGISDDIESGWSCSHKIVPDGSWCELGFTFDSPQNVMDVQVAVPYEDTYRSFHVEINREVIGYFGSHQQVGVIFMGLGVKASDVSTLTLRYTYIDDFEWISVFEVRFLVEP